MKRAIRISVIVETTLEDDALRDLMQAFTHDLTKDIKGGWGRILATAGEVPPEEAAEMWKRLDLGDEPKPNATAVKPKRRHLS